MSLIAVVTTVASRDEARAIAASLVERGLVACAQISQIESFYRWQGELQQEPEFRLLVKTVRERYGEVEAAIRALHSYELPAIHAFELAEVYPPYREWVEQRCTESSAR